MRQMKGLFGYYECVFLEECHCRDNEFKVTIPALFAIKDQYDPVESQTESLNSDVIVNKNKDHIQSTFESTTIIYARNHTPYVYQLRGWANKEKMKGTDGITEPNEPIVEGTYTDVKEHTHDIKEPMSIFDWTFEELNNVAIPKGSIGYGFFVNGSMDADAFVITHIPCVVPYDEEDAGRTFYQK